MITLIYNTFSNLIMNYSDAVEQAMLNIGMSNRSVDYIMLMGGTATVLFMVCLMVIMATFYFMMLRTSYIRMTRLKKKTNRIKYARIFVALLVLLVVDGIALFL